VFVLAHVGGCEGLEPVSHHVAVKAHQKTNQCEIFRRNVTT
jgi:hypothetical protein